MKIAIIYDSKYGNTKQLAEFIADSIRSSGHEVRLYRTRRSKAKDLLAFEPEALLVGGPTHMGGPARALGKYLKKIGKKIKKRPSVEIKKTGIFNCYVENIVCDKIKDKISDCFPDIKIYEKFLPIKVGGMKGPLLNNWKDQARFFIDGFLSFLV